MRDALLELVEQIDSRYNTCLEPACRAVGGISRGAFWALKVGLNNLDRFGALGAHSLPGPPISSSRLRSLTSGLAEDEMPRIYMDTGHLDAYRKGAAEFQSTLTLLNLPHEWFIFEGAHHEPYWELHLEDYLRWYSAGFQQN
jgi:S-formylglutathione hydrolase FrmB